MARFQTGNKAAAKEPKVVLRKFRLILDNAMVDKDILSWQDACLSIGWRVTKCDYWADKLSVFGMIKKEVHQIVISRVNKGAIKNEMNPTSCIWRMKQSGERDEKVVDNKSSDGSMTPKEPIDYSNVSSETLKKFREEAANANKS